MSASSMARRTAGMLLVTPVEVSLWTTATALMVRLRSAISFSPMTAASTPCRQSPGMKSTSSPSFTAMSRHSVANWPVSTISTVSPGDSVLTNAASHAPVPDAE